MNHCCEKFAKEASQAKPMAGGGMLYPPGAQHTAQIEPSADGQTWNINGCCGGCYVVTGVKFCPFCGSKLGKSE